MVTLDMLWLPILASTVLVFLASNLVWMVLPFHRSDTQRLKDEAATVDVLGRQGFAPGIYRFPWADDMKAMREPAFVEKLKKGPVGYLTILPSGEFNMGKALASWIAYVVVVSLFVAYVTGRALPAGTHYLGVFRIAGTVAFLAYSAAHVADGIWWGKPWRNVAKEVVDGLFYGLVTAGAFGWLWPR
jgi:hypothetical protein